jgi:anti-sigma regulatory factor (Ser/Thr protein kinase)
MSSVAVPTPKLVLQGEFGPDEMCAGKARRLVRTALRLWQLNHLADDVEQVAAELIANAVEGGAYRVVISREAARILVAVHDNRPGTPVLKSAGLDAESGRGLHIVEALADEWQHEGDVVWASFTIQEESHQQPD